MTPVSPMTAGARTPPSPVPRGSTAPAPRPQPTTHRRVRSGSGKRGLVGGFARIAAGDLAQQTEKARRHRHVGTATESPPRLLLCVHLERALGADRQVVGR